MKNDKLKFLILNGPNINFLGIREPDFISQITRATSLMQFKRLILTDLTV